MARYPIKQVVLVADRGLLSLDNLEAIRQIKVGDEPLEFILAVPARRYGEFDLCWPNSIEQPARRLSRRWLGNWLGRASA